MFCSKIYFLFVSGTKCKFNISFFKAILSCRIGNRLLPTSIPEEEFKEIINFLQNKDLKLNLDSLEISTKNIFDLCYKLDNNETPKFYKLLDITTILPAFKDSVSVLFLF